MPSAGRCKPRTLDLLEKKAYPYLPGGWFA